MKLSKLVKRIFSTILIFVILFLGAAISIPYFFKEEILVKIKEEANNTLNANLPIRPNPLIPTRTVI